MAARPRAARTTLAAFNKSGAVSTRVPSKSKIKVGTIRAGKRESSHYIGVIGQGGGGFPQALRAIKSRNSSVPLVDIETYRKTWIGLRSFWLLEPARG